MMNVYKILENFSRLFPSLEFITIKSSNTIYLRTTNDQYKQDIAKYKFKIGLWIVLDFDVNHNTQELIINV